MPYAIIKTGGKQFRVETGRTYKIPSVVGEEGGKIEFNDVLLGNDGKNVKTGIPALKGASVTGEIVRHGRGDKGGRGKDRGRGQGGKHHDRRPPGGKFHDQVASMEPVEATAAPAPSEVQQPHAEAQPVAPAKRHQDKPHQDKAQGSRHEKRPPHEKRGGGQRQHNEQAARSEVVDKSDLPAFLFRPVPVKKLDPQ